MKKIIFTIAIISLAGSSLWAKKVCRSYATKIKEKQSRKVSTCKFNKRKKYLECRDHKRKMKYRYYFKSVADFVNHNLVVGVQKVDKVKLSSDESINLEYDGAKLKAVVSTARQTFFNKYDDKNRNIEGTARSASCRDVKVTVTYDDKARSESFTYSGGKLKEKGCEYFADVVSTTIYDKNGNELSKVQKYKSDVLSAEVFQVLKTRRVCARM